MIVELKSWKRRITIKNKLRKMIAMLLVLCTVFSVCGTASAAAFNDVSSYAIERPYFDAINYVSDRGIMEGNEDGDFLPSSGATRGMVVTTLFRISGDTGTYNQASQFTDVPSGNYYYNAVGWAVANGITTGVTATEFKPNRIVTWAEFFTFLYRYAGYKDLPQEAEESITGASDYSSVGSWARRPISWAYTYGMLLRSNPNAPIYPTANLDRKTLALFLARFRRNVEGINRTRDSFCFLNDHPDMVSGCTVDEDNKIHYQRKLISNEDWERLITLANASENPSAVKSALNGERIADWKGSCYGFALATALDNHGKINLSGNCADYCNTLYDIPRPVELTHYKHRITRDVYYPSAPVLITEIESKLNMYRLSWNIPVLKNWAVYTDANRQLRALEQGQMYAGIGLFTYSYETWSNEEQEYIIVAHSINTYGRPEETANGFKIKVYDSRYTSSNCYIEVNTSNQLKWVGTVVTTDEDMVQSRDRIIECKYQNDFSLFNTYLDFDWADNSRYVSGRMATTAMENGRVDVLDEVDINGESVSLKGKTVIQVVCGQDFEIANEMGQRILHQNGKISGTMKIYGVDIMSTGQDTPCEYAFLVDDSSSFTCSKIDNDAKILSFTAIGSEAVGSISVDNMDDTGWQTVSVGETNKLTVH